MPVDVLCRGDRSGEAKDPPLRRGAGRLACAFTCAKAASLRQEWPRRQDQAMMFIRDAFIFFPADVKVLLNQRPVPRRETGHKSAFYAICLRQKPAFPPEERDAPPETGGKSGMGITVEHGKPHRLMSPYTLAHEPRQAFFFVPQCFCVILSMPCPHRPP